MKNINEIFIFVLALVCCVSYCGCGQIKDKSSNINIEKNFDDEAENKEDIIKVNFNLKFINISGKTAEETVEEIKGGGNCLDIYENEDGTITVEINKKQQEYWLTSREELLEELQEQLKEYDENYRLEHNNSYTQVDAYYNQELPWDKAGSYVVYAEWLCASYQLFSEEDSSSWRVDINIYNSDTGKLVKSGSSDASLTYDNSDWEASK